MANLCVGSKEASQRVINCDGVTALIAACDHQESGRSPTPSSSKRQIRAVTDREKSHAVDAVKTEAFRGLLIIAQAGPSFRATVLREIGIRTRYNVTIGRCTAHLYDLARRIKVEACTERRDDIPQTIAGLGKASKEYLFQAGPLARGFSMASSAEPAHSVPGMRSPSTAAFRQSGRVLSVQRPQHHRDRLERERQQRIVAHSTICSVCDGQTADPSPQVGPSSAASYVCTGCQSSLDNESVPKCRNVDRHHRDDSSSVTPATSPKPRQSKDIDMRDCNSQCRKKIIPSDHDSDNGDSSQESDQENGEDESAGNWAMAVWAFVRKPLVRPPARVAALQELNEDMFQIGTALGRGGFATVYLAKNLRTEELVAVKRFHPVASGLPGAKKKTELAVRRAIKEQRIWDGLEHRNIVGYRGCFFGKNGELNLVAEYIAGWSLADHLSQITKFPDHLVARITRQIVDGLGYLHGEGVTHRDIKPANILVDPDGVIKLADFGVSSAVDVPTMTGNTLVGTPWYIAPEMIEGRPYGKSVDIWSLGCTVMELATGKRPYHDLRPHEALFRIAQDRRPPPIPSGVSPQLRDFLLTCWVWDPEKRPLTAHLKRHPFLANMLRDSAGSAS
jgi:hypothetical protein